MLLEIGKNIKRLRLESGLTQRLLAYRLRVSVQAVSKWERGAAYPDITLLPQIAMLFGVSIDRLFHDNDKKEIRLSDASQ
ncbi:MAG: helix-turn-helix transcriptional regulator [Ruminococcaceae bacterium]|nr:helix-turn-helix transcriptional regulator [Oscillospiraceae bacterium]